MKLKDGNTRTLTLRIRSKNSLQNKDFEVRLQPGVTKKKRHKNPNLIKSRFLNLQQLQGTKV